MTIYRHKKTGFLYVLEMVKRRCFTEGPWLCATPYKHNNEIMRYTKRGNPKTKLSLNDFIAVAHC